MLDMYMWNFILLFSIKTDYFINVLSIIILIDLNAYYYKFDIGLRRSIAKKIGLGGFLHFFLKVHFFFLSSVEPKFLA